MKFAVFCSKTNILPGSDATPEFTLYGEEAVQTREVLARAVYEDACRNSRCEPVVWVAERQGKAEILAWHGPLNPSRVSVTVEQLGRLMQEAR